MGVEHGMIIGLEEDRQGLLNKRVELEKAEMLAQVITMHPCGAYLITMHLCTGVAHT